MQDSFISGSASLPSPVLSRRRYWQRPPGNSATCLFSLLRSEELTIRDLPTYNDMIAAAARIAGYASRTPVMSSRTPNEKLDAEVFFECGNLQRMGAFKLRGALNALSWFSTEQRAAGAVAFSSGNHTQAIALSACLLGVPVIIVMLADAPAMKIEATRGYDEQVVLHDRYMEDREQIGCDLTQRHGLALIPPYDRPDVLAGQDTVAKELFEGAGPLDALFVPPGSDGLLSNCVLVIRALVPTCRVYGVGPEAGNDSQRPLHSGAIIYIDTPQTLIDDAQTQHLGNLTFSLI